MNIKIIVQSLFFINVVFCQKAFITQTNSQYCSGMYNKRDWSGKIDPYIKLDLEQFKYNGEHSATTAADVSVLIFEYRDLPLLGKIDNTGRIRYVCDQEMVNIGACTEDELNNFLTGDDSDNSKSKILIIKLTDLGDNDVAYNIVNTGYYCVATYSPAQASTGGSMFNSYKIKVNFQNSFGSLAASEIPKLPLYGLLAVVYAVFFSVYLFHVYKHRAELLLLQKYLAGFFAFLTVETILIWSLYEIRNNNKKYPLPGGIKFYITIVSLLNAFKLSFSLFLLLIISLGYGVVYPKLNKSLMLHETKTKIMKLRDYVKETADDDDPSRLANTLKELNQELNKISNFDIIANKKPKTPTTVDPVPTDDDIINAWKAGTLNGFKVDQLRKYVRSRNNFLETASKKADLIANIDKYFQQKFKETKA